MSAIETVVLDLGNVLLFHDNRRLFRRLGERAGLGVDEVDRRLSGAGWEDANRGVLDEEGVRRSVCSALGVDLPMGEFFPLWNSHFTVHERVLPLVESLVGRVKLVLLSNTNWLHVKWFRPRLPVLDRFDQVLYSCALGRVKPEPEIYREALARSGTVHPDRAIFFDDVPEYVEAAKRVGMQARAFTTADAFARDLRDVGLITPAPA